MYFYDDEVYKITNRGRCVFGFVLEKYYEGNSSEPESDAESDAESDEESGEESDEGRDEESDSESDSDAPAPLHAGEILVVWHPSGLERVVAEKTVGLSDRYIQRGQVVRRRVSQAAQLGYVRDVIIAASLKVAATKHVLQCVLSDRLEPLVARASDYVCLDSWVGYARIKTKLRLVSSDGSRLEYADSIQCHLKDYGKHRHLTSDSYRMSPEYYYLGQVLYGKIASIRNANWMHTTDEMKAARKNKLHKHKFTVEAVTEMAHVQWMRRAERTSTTADSASAAAQPKSVFEGDELKLLKRLNVCNRLELKPGVRNLITISENDVFITTKQWQKEQSRKYRQLRKQSHPSKESKQNEEKHTVQSTPKKKASRDSSEPSRRAEKGTRLAVRPLRGKRLKRAVQRPPAAPPPPQPGSRVVVETLHTSSRTEIVWEDGAIETDIPSTELRCVYNLEDDHEYIPGDFVVSGAAADDDNKSRTSHRDYGVLQKVDHHGRTAIVKWYRTYRRADEPVPQLMSESEVVSFYELKQHPGFQYRPGLGPRLVVSRVANFTDRDTGCTAGVVMDQCPSGEVKVMWADGHTSMCWPQDIKIVKRDLAESFRTYAESFFLQDMLALFAKATNIDQTLPLESDASLAIDESAEIDTPVGATPEHAKDLEGKGFSLAESASADGEGFSLTKPVSSEDEEFSLTKSASAEGEGFSRAESAPVEEEASSLTESVPAEGEGFSLTESAPAEDEGFSLAEFALAEGEGFSLANPAPAVDEGFSLEESAPATHHFHPSKLQPSEPRAFYYAVKREIKLMKSDLPPGVWVRAFEDRIDLMSLMIAGPKKTPYEDGLFLFDVHLGGEYPHKPPACHYISYCRHKLNPNLYEDGKVCVSLLGTWRGRGVELWSKESSLLQVIVSLQGLILNAEPYFNEPGYEKQKGSQEGKDKSQLYNEMVLLKLVQSMTKLVGNPPEMFRAEILRHFRAGAADMCRRLEAWIAMSLADSTAQAHASAIPPPDFPLVPASRGCCLTLRSSLEAFRRALRRHDIPVDSPAL